MELTAAPIVRQPLSVIGAPGKTDFVRIYIASELNKAEYRTVLRHEQAHIWSFHKKRAPENVRHDLWNIACDMEIARVIYDKEDIDNIKSPRSRIRGGILPDSIEGLPNEIIMAEEIYEWLIGNKSEEKEPQNMCATDSSESEINDDIKITKSEINSLAEEARNKLDKDEEENKSKIAAYEAYSLIKNRPPTLTNEIDATLRSRVQHEHSYRRPSRRHEGSNIVMPGAISIPRPPLVEIFVDRSGSFNPEKTAQAELNLKLILRKYGVSIKSDVWFFGNGKLLNEDYGGGGDTPYHLIYEHINLTFPKLAIIITDDDPVHESVSFIDKRTKILCIPIGCKSTLLAKAIGGIDVVTR